MGRGDHQGLLVLASVAAVLLAFVGRESVAGIDVNYELVRQLKTQTDKHANTLDKVNHTGTILKVRAITNGILVLKLAMMEKMKQ